VCLLVACLLAALCFGAHHHRWQALRQAQVSVTGSDGDIVTGPHADQGLGPGVPGALIRGRIRAVDLAVGARVQASMC
jgi:hypothetical protein